MRPLIWLLTCCCALIVSTSNAFGQNSSNGAGAASGGAGLSITAGQGFSRGLSSNSATATVPNGVPGFVFGGTVSPFVTGVVPVLGAGTPGPGPVGLSPIQSMLTRGDIQIQKDAAGNRRLIVNELPKRVSTERPKAKPDAGTNSNSFRRGIEKYAGPKR